MSNYIANLGYKLIVEVPLNHPYPKDEFDEDLILKFIQGIKEVQDEDFNINCIYCVQNGITLFKAGNCKIWEPRYNHQYCLYWLFNLKVEGTGTDEVLKEAQDYILGQVKGLTDLPSSLSYELIIKDNEPIYIN